MSTDTLEVGDIVRMTALFGQDIDAGLRLGDLGVVRVLIGKTGDCLVTWFNGRGHEIAMTYGQLEKIDAAD